MGIISFCRLNNIRDYKELQKSKETAYKNGEDFNENEWIRNKLDEHEELGDFKPKISKKQAEKQYQKDRLAQLKRDHVPFCPKCKSTNLTFVDKKLSLGRAVVGGAVGTLAGPLGVAAGATMGGLSSKKGKVKCLNCGHTWKIK
jgi:Zn finger protein HypA/HybF involved in hydrogenase expression